MCRFIAYIGKTPTTLSSLLEEPKNSLIKQSKSAQESGKTGLNADGFGVSWYQHEVDSTPALYRATGPAWSDTNLLHIAKKTSSTCFLGHIRAATIGEVNFYNCHPFIYKEYSFVHNGTIRNFNVIRRDLLNMLDDDIFNIIRGHTDSEHLFAFIMQQVKNQPTPNLALAMQDALTKIQLLQKQHNQNCISRINTALTDGHQMVITRYISDTSEKPISLYYTLQPTLIPNTQNMTKTGIIIASEPLSGHADHWEEVPLNTMLIIEPSLSVSLQEIILTKK